MKKKFSAFTLSRHAELVSASSETLKRVQGDVTSVRRAFTFAEVLITLMVIGVVAVLTIPAMMTAINDKVLERQQDVFTKKFTEGLRQMRVDGKLSQKYARTEDFVNEMKNYFKIGTVCKNTNLTGCFQENFSYQGAGSGIVTDEKTGKKSLKSDESKNFTLTNGMKAKNIKDTVKYDADVMGVVFADGVQMLLYVNPECVGPAEGDTEGNVTSCISYLADVNQAKSPNQIEKDIVSNIPFANIDFEIIEGPKGIAPRGSEISCAPSGRPSAAGRADYWFCAMDYCAELNGSLPDAEQLTKLAKAMGYGDPNICPSQGITLDGEPYSDGCNEDIISANSLWRQLGGGSDFRLWSGDFDQYSWGVDNYFRTFWPSCSYSEGPSNPYEGYVRFICVR